MKIDVKKVAKLSNLTVTDNETKELTSQLNEIVGYIEQLNALDTKDVEPTAQVTGLTNRLRDDVLVTDSLSQEDALAGTKEKHNGLFKVGKLVDTTN